MLDTQIGDKDKNSVYKAAGLFLIILSVFFVIKIVHEIRGERYLKEGEMSIITIAGHGEVQAVPDIANVYFTITKQAKTAKEAQDAVAQVEAEALASLKENKVELKDIKTENASFNPKYEWQSETGARLPCNEWDGCNYGKSVIVGYEATESITVKVRNTDDAGKIMQDLGAVGVSNLNGPSFSIDDEEALKIEARKKAIDNAREKAQSLAKDLGVRLGKITSYTEGSSYSPMYAKMESMNGASDAVSVPAQLPKGENTISSDVTITYEIR
jgi:uncharacterized protein YggE